MNDEPLSPDERAAMDGLPKEMPLPAGLEDRVVTSLRASGHVRMQSRRAWIGRLAAAVVIFLAGFAAARLPWPGGVAPSEGDEYLLLLYGAPSASPAEEEARVAEYRAWANEEREAGRLVGAEKLAGSFMLLGSPGGGPSNPAEPSGFFLLRAATASEAAQAAQRCPHVRHGGTVVVRPVEKTD
jgi:hypothetical protein